MRVAVVGYGRLGRAVELVAEHFSEVEVDAVFTSRPPAEVMTVGAPIYPLDSISDFISDIDCLLVC